jgi:hypothetical protein
MTQEEIIELVRDIHPEVDDEGVDIVYDNGEYDVDVRFTSWDCLFTAEIYSKYGEVPLEMTSKTMTNLFDYVVDLHTEYMRDLKSMIDTRDYLDIYER